ncbi:MAG TPA: PilC/PilY family type IV pilus protein [Steroidobacteraceae bacterium]|jgi:type IV pilus assembly protein PilY1|nr:PilC/PilY family type IV pilus protein [Steroidobacteraceae bacterium]
MKFKIFSVLMIVLGLSVASIGEAQTLLSEDFTGTTSSVAKDSNGNVLGGNWLFFNGACLTAGNSPVTTTLSIPGCVIDGVNDVLGTYYMKQENHDLYLSGGSKGYLGSTAAPGTGLLQAPDPSGKGALRFTNGQPYGHGENGAIVSAYAYPTNAGIQVTFKTVTYYGDGGGNGQSGAANGKDGADGLSFYLVDGCVPIAGAIKPTGPTPCSYPANSPYGNNTTADGSAFSATGAFAAIGAWGGSLAYTCNNGANGPVFNGLTGAYLGLGIDEYGNFLNGTTNTQGFGSNSNLGDNTADGGGQYANRIGLRGAGNISWAALNNAYANDPNDLTKPYYPTSLLTCPAGSNFDSNANICAACPTGSTYSPAGTSGQVGSCSSITTTILASCPAGYNSPFISPINGQQYCIPTSAASQCVTAGAGYTYQGTGSAISGRPAGYCLKGASKKNPDSVTGTVASTTVTPESVTTSVVPAQYAVEQTCKTGKLWNYKGASASGGTSSNSAGLTTLHNAASNANPGNTADILDYPAIPGGYNVLTGLSIANESANTRTGTSANPTTTIYYNLKITTDGLLSLSYATDITGNGPGSYQPVLTNLSITGGASAFSNGALPNYVRFGFAGSTGGASNIHEIMCFKSVPVVQSASSAGVNQKQSAKVESGTFAYFAFYDPNKWVGRVTANSLTNTADSNGVETVSISATPTWDAACVLNTTTATQCSTGVATTAQAPTSRVIVTYNGTAGAPFEWANLSTTTPGQQATLAVGDAASAPSANRVNFLRGDRTQEVNSSATCGQLTTSSMPCFRARDSVLGDIIDSSPTWVGPPQSPYTATWGDKFDSATAPVPPENSGQTYVDFASKSSTGKLTRENIVYVGANDGMLHGFRSGASAQDGSFDMTAPNDGQEVFAYVPGSILQSPVSPSFTGCTSPMPPTATAGTYSIAQNIHGVDPAVGATAACTVSALDYSNVHYGHNFYVDATPGTGDLFYGGKWHTWLVGGLGAGGAAIYALDVTDPVTAIAANASSPETAAAALVLGEWNSSTITCQLPASGCNANLGNTYGTPIIRRLHDGDWAVIFGNGFGSQTGDAGIYVMIVDPTSGSLGGTVANPGKVYYLSACGTSSTCLGGNGIGFVTSADLDGDHITDYVYAGDLKGNVWRFDLTNPSESSWAVTPGPLFKTKNGQPITSALTVASGATPAGVNTLMIDFGTGQKNPLTNLNAAWYPSTVKQSLYGIWDWNLSTWNAKSAIQYATVPSADVPSGLSYTNLLQNVAVANGTTVDISGTSTVCWMDSSTTCSGAAGQFGWYMDLPGSQGTGSAEQIIYNPQVLGSAFQVNSIVPASNSGAACTINTDKGFSYAVSVLSGAIIPNFFIQYADAQAAGVETDATGTSFPVTAANGSTWLIYQTVTNQPQAMQVNLGANTVGRRLTWVQLR